MWLTAAGAPETFIKAGELGVGVLTHLLGQSLREVKEKIELYRESLVRHGHDARRGKVTLMLHTFIGKDREEVREKVRVPFTNYLKSSVGLISNLVKSLDLPLKLESMNEKDMSDLLGYAFDRYFETSALFGNVETCEQMIDQLKEIDVDEIDCLIDFGVDIDAVLSSLHELKLLKDRSNEESDLENYSIAAQAERYEATLMQCTPSLMSIFSLDSSAMQSLKRLRALMLGGEALPSKIAGQIKEQLPAKLINMYGPTETTIWSATHEVKEVASVVPIGKPIANTDIYILDDKLMPVPVGIAGELCIGGYGVARGYLNQPALSAERFIPDSFNDEPGARIYRTGDLARFLPDGNIEFLGRIDHQVKIRGYRIELEEIEAVIGTFEGVRETVISAREDVPGDKRLVAYIVSGNGRAFSVNDLRSYLKEKLPDYMVPSAFVTMKALPQTNNGKVDRKSLPAPEGVRTNGESKYAPPQSVLEETIAAVWRQTLRVDRVGIDDNFFDIGGHSLLMAQVHSQLRDVLKRDLPLIKILEHPTIRSLAEYLVEEKNEQLSSHRNYERAQKQRQMLLRGRKREIGYKPQ